EPRSEAGRVVGSRPVGLPVWNEGCGDVGPDDWVTGPLVAHREKDVRRRDRLQEEREGDDGAGADADVPESAEKVVRHRGRDGVVARGQREPGIPKFVGLIVLGERAELERTGSEGDHGRPEEGEALVRIAYGDREKPVRLRRKHEAHLLLSSEG